MGSRFGNPWLLLLPLLVLYVFVFVIPIGDLLVTSVLAKDKTLTLSNFKWFVGDSLVRAVVVDSLLIAFGTAFICLILGFPLAYQASRNSALRLVIVTLVIFPLLTSSVVRTFGWQVLLFPNGLVANAARAIGIADPPALIGTKLGIAIALAGVLMPFMVLTLFNTINSIDESLEEAALDLGDHPYQVWWRVTLPLAKNGLMGGTLLVLSLALSAYVTPRLIGQSKVQTLATMIYNQAITLLQYNRAAAISVALLALTALTSLVSAKYFKSEKQ